jgi:hypothetical protein
MHLLPHRGACWGKKMTDQWARLSLHFPAFALLLESTPTMAPSEVLEKMLENAVTNALTGLSSSCPNKLLYVGADAL